MKSGNNSSNVRAVGTAAEFFAGIGLVRVALERAGWSVRYANDFKPFKREMYRANFPRSEIDPRDVRQVKGPDIPEVDLATASFPCIDLSLAGSRRGLEGKHSGLFWEFARVVEEMDDRRPQFVLIENVAGFLTSNGGTDLRAALSRLNGLGYWCDVLVTDARWYVPQSRKRLFVVGSLGQSDYRPEKLHESPLRPSALIRFLEANADLNLAMWACPEAPNHQASLDDVVERLSHCDGRWWNAARICKFKESLSERHHERLMQMVTGGSTEWATAYRRMRKGSAVWEIRPDQIAGCLRACTGGSSKQALVEAGMGSARVRWMTPLEYARLQGAGDFPVPDSVTNNQALGGFGDAVCVPGVEWIIREFLNPMVGLPVQRLAIQSMDPHSSSEPTALSQFRCTTPVSETLGNG